MSDEETMGWFKLGDKPGMRFLKDQLKGLEPLQKLARRATVLDCGCAEGLIGRWLMDTAGADVLHGIELVPERIEEARKQCAGYSSVRFEVGDLAQEQDWLEPRYDVVLMLAILHKLRDPIEVLKRYADMAEVIAIRLPTSERTFTDERSGNVKISPMKILRGFDLVSDVLGPRNERTMIWQRPISF